MRNTHGCLPHNAQIQTPAIQEGRREGDNSRVMQLATSVCFKEAFVLIPQVMCPFAGHSETMGEPL